VPDGPAAIARSAEEVTKVNLSGLRPALAGDRHVNFEGLQALYESVSELAGYVDGWTD
jgi:hypothetical protein